MSESAGKYRKRYVDRLLGKSKICLSKAPGIILMNARSWETLVLITLKVSVLRTTGIILYQGKKLTGRRNIIPLFIMWWMKSYYMKHKKWVLLREAPEFLYSHYDYNNLYQVESMSLEETKDKIEWRKRAFECEQKSPYGIGNKNYMTCIHDKKIAEYNLLHDIINPPKRTKKKPLLSYSTWMYEY